MPDQSKPIYDIDKPDQARLKTARAEIEAIFQKHDLAGAVVLHTPGMVETFASVSPSYSNLKILPTNYVHVRSKLEDYAGDREAQMRDLAATANMARCFAEELTKRAVDFIEITKMVDRACNAEHGTSKYVPDPREKSQG